MTGRAHLATAVLLLLGPVGRGLGDEAPFTKGVQLFQTGQYDQAIETLTGYLKQTGNKNNAAQALYTLAMIHEARGRLGEATQALEQLVSGHPTNPWSLNGHALLARRAATEGSFERAAQHIAPFLDLYLGGEYATIDDPVCHEEFELLVACARKASPAASLRDLHRSLTAKYPVVSATGRVVAYWVGVDPTDPEANLVLNPGFELDGRAIGTPVGWQYCGSEPNLEDDIDGALPAGMYIKELRVHTGAYVAGKFTGWGVHRGWLYQRVPVLPGKRYEVSAYGLTPAPDKDAKPGQLRLGADPAAGTHPSDGSVVWTEPVSPRDEYARLELAGDRALTPTGQFITVYLELRQDTPTAPNAMLFDDVAVRQAK